MASLLVQKSWSVENQEARCVFCDKNRVFTEADESDIPSTIWSNNRMTLLPTGNITRRTRIWRCQMSVATDMIPDILNRYRVCTLQCSVPTCYNQNDFRIFEASPYELGNPLVPFGYWLVA